jgi:hypothetical protein
VLYKRLLLLVLSFLLFACDSEDGSGSIVFTGNVRIGDQEPYLPLRDVLVKVRWYGGSLDLIGSDSVRTDASGNYTVTTFDDATVRQYAVSIRDEYYFECSSFIQPVITDFKLPKDVATSKVNTDTLNVCVTGVVSMTLAKTEELARDTLTITPKIRVSPSLTFIESPATVHASGQLVYHFFTDRVSTVEYNFELRKEDGETTNWTTEISVEPQMTESVSVTF